MKSLRYKAVILGVAALTLASCSDKLDTMPDNRTELDTPEKIADLLVNAYPQTTDILVNETMSDNSDYYGAANPNGSRFMDQVYFWQDVTETDNESPELFWTNNYLAIANANQAIESIDELGGPSANSQLAASYGEALLCRAYCHFLLVNEFCQNYNPETSDKDLGIPYLDKVENFTEHHDRGTVAEVYQHIDQDLQEGLKYVTDNYKVPKYHFNRKAAYAFAARFYLFYNQWQKVVDYANLALGSDASAVLRDYQTMGNMTQDFDALTLHYIGADLNCNLMLNTYISQDGAIFGAYVIYSRYGHGSYLGNHEDIAARNVWGQNNSYEQPLIRRGNNFDVCRFWKLPYRFEYTDPVARIGYPHIVVPEFDTDETLLCRAEAYALLKEYDKSASDASTWIHNFYNTSATITPASVQQFMNSVDYSYDDAEGLESTVKKHLNPGFAIDAEGSEQESLLQLILDCRRIETLHQGLRWFDVKRYGIEIPRREMGADGYPLRILDKLTKNDPRRAVQIPQQARDAGIEANPR